MNITMRKMILKKKNIIHILTIIFFSFYLCDKILVSLDRKPIFAIITNYYKDGGTQYKLGLGYSVILWNQIAVEEKDGKKINGYKTGKEFINFPKCYINFYDLNLEPTKELKFIKNNELREKNKTDEISMYISFLLDFFIIFIPIIYSLIVVFIIVYYFRKIYKIIMNKKVELKK
jgi:hypothetical protein